MILWLIVEPWPISTPFHHFVQNKGEDDPLQEYIQPLQEYIHQEFTFHVTT